MCRNFAQDLFREVQVAAKQFTTKPQLLALCAQKERMKPIIISYDCSDHDPIDKWVPDDVFDVDFWMNFTIGPDNQGGDNFQVRVVTPNNLHGKYSIKHAIVLNQYAWPKVIAAVEAMLEQCQGVRWEDISQQLSRLMYWEFDDYQPYEGTLP